MNRRFDSASPSAITVPPDRQRSNLQKGLAELEESIRRNGILQPIVVDRSLTLIAGGRRLQAALNLGLASVPVCFVEALSSGERRILELEENVKREDLDWRDHVRAVAAIHAALSEERGAGWTVSHTANRIGFDSNWVRRILRIASRLHEPAVAACSSINAADMLLTRIAERQAAEIINGIVIKSAEAFVTAPPPPPAPLPVTESADVPPPPPPTAPPTTAPTREERRVPPAPREATAPPSAAASRAAPVLNADFRAWVASYDGPKFNLIHVDFPYGTALPSRQRAHSDREGAYANSPVLFEELCDAFRAGFPRFASYSSHVVFWFPMQRYEFVRAMLASCGLWVWDFPLIWTSPMGKMAPSQGQTPKRSYHTAFLASCGERPLVRHNPDSYQASEPSKPAHPAHKPEPMLRHFLAMLIDTTSTVFDPTCGSGSALLAAEDLGAKHIFGLEADPEYAAAANARLINARLLRNVSASVG